MDEVLQVAAPPMPAGLDMPAEIAVAILDVMGKVKALTKDAEASAGRKFKYTSVDQFYEALGPLMAQAGLLTMLHEDAVEIVEKQSIDDRSGDIRKSTWMSTRYAIWLYHSTGVRYGPIYREIQVIASGPQSYGMGPSFVEKYFLRALFKISTGEEDLEAQPQVTPPSNRERAPDKHIDRSPTQKAPIERTREYIANCKKEWTAIKTQAEMGAWWRATKEQRVAHFPNADDPLYIEFKNAFTNTGSELPLGEKPPAAEQGKTTVNGTPAGAPAAEKKPDDIPGFAGDGRPSESSIRLNFRRELQAATTKDGCNEAFIKWVEPWEKSLPKEFIDEVWGMLNKRTDELPA